MIQGLSCSCGALFEDEDAYCGDCGSPRATVPGSSGPDTLGEETGEFFSHARGQVPRRMGNATRYLCAAAHLDPRFMRDVLFELIGARRAVVPSRGIDLEPVVRHCLMARKMSLARDLVLTALLILGVFVALGQLILILAIAFCLRYLPSPGWHRRSFGFWTIAQIIMALAVVGVVVFLYVEDIGTIVIALGAPSLPSFQENGWTGVIGGAYFCGVAGTLLAHGQASNQILARWLRPDSPVPEFAPVDGPTGTRLGQIRDAQHGNLTIYSGEDPFLGTGGTPFEWRTADPRVGSAERAWSIAIELNQKTGISHAARSAGRVAIDPVALHEILRERMLNLSDASVPRSERVTSLTVDDHVVGEGRFRWGSPLLDPVRVIPYSRAGRSAVEALIRHPQARLRYYQRVSISDEGQEVWAGDQRVVEAADREVIVSAFVYVAVEGHMFYLQFVPTSLNPIADRYHLVDQLPAMAPGQFTAKVVLDTARAALSVIGGAPLFVIGTLWRMWRESRVDANALQSRDSTVYADIGARMSVRQLGARDVPSTYIQQLDVTKYTQIVERLVLETVLDYLDAQGADTTAYKASAQAIYNSGIYVEGDVRGSTLTTS